MQRTTYWLKDSPESLKSYLSRLISQGEIIISVVPTGYTLINKSESTISAAIIIYKNNE